MTTLALDFPLCADPARDELLRPLVDRSVAFLVEQVGAPRLDTVILTGSLARGEGSVLLRPDGFRVLGDIEFIFVIRPPYDWPVIRRWVSDLNRRATREIGHGGRVASIEYGPASTVFLGQKIEPGIFAYDLRRHGKVVWGRRDALQELRPFGVENIPRWDAVELIMNRMVELLVLEDGGTDGSAPEERAYHLVKIPLDLAGSALAFAGRYVSPYAERHNAFVAMLNSMPDLRAALPEPDGFCAELARVVACKLAPTDTLLLHGASNERAVAVSSWARGFWLWEMRRLLGRPSGQFSDLLDAYISHESLGERLRHWAKFLHHPLRPSGSIAPLRIARHVWRGSPRTMTYAAALLLCWAGQVDPRWRSRASALLPIRKKGNAHEVTASEVCDLWRWLIRNN